jgi:hypothetical protein
MSTLSLGPGAHPQRHAALAAHALREALQTIELLEAFPQCVGVVVDNRPFVRIGDISADAALALAQRLVRRSVKRVREPTSGPEGGAS